MDIPWIPWPETEERGMAVMTLFRAVCEAHYVSATENDNVSSAAVRLVRSGNPGQPMAAIAAAVLTVGQRHGPVDDARAMWRMDDDELRALRDSGATVAGFGNAFWKDDIDPAWNPVRDILTSLFPEEAKRLEAKAAIMQEKSTKLHPNPGCFTAIACEVGGIPQGRSHLLYLFGRIPAWMCLP